MLNRRQERVAWEGCKAVCRKWEGALGRGTGGSEIGACRQRSTRPQAVKAHSTGGRTGGEAARVRL